MRKIALFSALTVTVGIRSALAQTSLLNVSCDPTRELYKDYDAVFASRMAVRASRRWRARWAYAGWLTTLTRCLNAN